MKDVELERIFKAVANRRRLALLRYIKKHKEASVGELRELIKISMAATSKHLAVLSAAGIVEREQRSLLMFYRISPTPPLPARAILSIL